MMVGSFALVLHSHLPWVAGHGSWPVGEEWLYQAWAGAYLPLVEVLGRLADEGRRDLLTLGVTPVLAAQLDDPGCLHRFGSWTVDWQLRADELAGRPAEPGGVGHRQLAAREHAAAGRAMSALEGGWRHGGAPVLRGLADVGAVELLGGPATHPFLPLLEPAVASFALRIGLDDARARLGRRPAGIWAPECGYAPGLESSYAAAGVSHFVVDEATLAPTGRPSSAAYTVGDSGVVVFARDLSVTNLVWSSRTGYPAGTSYRDFHARDPASGLQLWQVTGASDAKRPYEPRRAELAVQRDAEHFVGAVRRRLAHVAERDGRPGLVVAAYDTELFGHWWHEGPQFVEAVLRLMPLAGVRVTTLATAVRDGAVRGGVELPPGSWGAGKDYRVWAAGAAEPLLREGFWLQRRLLDVVARERAAGRLTARRPDLDRLARQALLALSSDWAFMVTREQAAEYARGRAADHTAAFHRLAEVVEAGSPPAAGQPRAQRGDDDLFGALDARLLRP